MGNLGSVLNMFKRIGIPATVTGEPSAILEASKLLLPGVGSFDRAKTELESRGLVAPLRSRVKDGVPLLGICLGMQLLTDGSEEGRQPGLGFIKGYAHRFPGSIQFKVPHMGWNAVYPSSPSALTVGLPQESRFYFVHSYYVTTADPSHSILKAQHGLEFDAAIQGGNVFGAQFHPEKSHKFGMHLLRNFGEL